MPVADQHRAGVVGGGIEPGAHLGHGRPGVRVAGEGERQFPAGPLRRVPRRGRLVGQAGHHPVLVDGQPGPAGQFVPAAQDPRLGGAEHGDRVGRPLVQLVPVRRDQQRHAGHGPGQGDEQAHVCDVTSPGAPTAGRQRASYQSYGSRSRLGRKNLPMTSSPPPLRRLLAAAGLLCAAALAAGCGSSGSPAAAPTKTITVRATPAAPVTSPRRGHQPRGQPGPRHGHSQPDRRRGTGLRDTFSPREARAGPGRRGQHVPGHRLHQYL